jgi:hypothetical protein
VGHGDRLGWAEIVLLLFIDLSQIKAWRNLVWRQETWTLDRSTNSILIRLRIEWSHLCLISCSLCSYLKLPQVVIPRTYHIRFI